MAALAKRIEKVALLSDWVSEVTAAMSHQPPGCLIAIVDGDLVGRDPGPEQ